MSKMSQQWTKWMNEIIQFEDGVSIVRFHIYYLFSAFVAAPNILFFYKMMQG